MNNSAKLGLLMPVVLNPVTAVVGVGLAIFWLFREDEEEATVRPPPNKPPKPTARAVVKPLPAVEQDVKEIVVNEAVSAPIPDEDQKEMIRRAMSELGKRSAAARAKKKAEREELKLRL